MAAPLRLLVSVFSAIAAGTFLPDESRSGRFVVACSNPLPETSSSESSASSEPAKESPSPGADQEPLFANIVKNLTTGTVHICDETGYKLKCGKELPLNLERMADLPAEPRLCSRCFY